MRPEATELCESKTIVRCNGIGEKIDGRKQVRFLLRELGFSLKVGSIGQEGGVEGDENFWVELLKS